LPIFFEKNSVLDSFRNFPSNPIIEYNRVGSTNYQHLATVTGHCFDDIRYTIIERILRSVEVRRSSFKRICDETFRALQSPGPDIFELKSKLDVLEEKMKTLKDLDNELINTLIENDGNDEDVDSEILKSDEILIRYKNFKFKIEDHLQRASTLADDVDDAHTSIAEENKRYKLPKIELKKFNSDIREWLSFWSQFKRIHEDSSLPNEDKFQYLIQSTTPKSRARQVIESFPPTGDNYSKAIDSLKSRFGREDLLVEVYVRELLKLILNNIHEKIKLSILYDKIETQLRALESLNIFKQSAAMLYPLIESCLPEEIIRVWQRSEQFSVDHTLDIRLDFLMKFLKKEVENEERIALATSFTNHKREDRVTPTSSALLNTKSKNCVFCKRDGHLSEECKEALKLLPLERKKILSEKGRCHLCLKFGHIASKCRSAAKLKCHECDGKHVTSMCFEQSKVEEPKTTENHSNFTTNKIFLQTLLFKLKGKYREKLVRALIDTGSERTYINKYTAGELGFESIGNEEMIHSLFGGLHSDIISHTLYKIEAESLDETYLCSFEALDQNIICSNICSANDGPWLEEMKKLNIQVPDIENHGPIEVLFGADIAGKLLCGPRHILKCGLVVMKTLLG